MRRKIQKAYDNSELILHTGHSYQFVSDYEKAKYVEYYLPEEDKYAISHNNVNTSKTLTRSEFEEIITLFEEEGKPVACGAVDGKGYFIYHESEYQLLEKILAYRKEREKREKIPANLEQEFPEWNQLTEKQKQLVVSLIREMVSKTEKS